MPKTAEEKADAAWAWATALDPKGLHLAVYTLSMDIDAYAPETRKAVLQAATIALGKVKEAS